jgi:hypothetical protein
MCPGCHDDPRSLVACWERLIQPTFRARESWRGYRGDDLGSRDRPHVPQRAQIGRTQQETDVRWIDRGGLHADEDLMSG